MKRVIEISFVFIMIFLVSCSENNNNSDLVDNYTIKYIDLIEDESIFYNTGVIDNDEIFFISIFESEQYKYIYEIINEKVLKEPTIKINDSSTIYQYYETEDYVYTLENNYNIDTVLVESYIYKLHYNGKIVNEFDLLKTIKNKQIIENIKCFLSYQDKIYFCDDNNLFIIDEKNNMLHIEINGYIKNLLIYNESVIIQYNDYLTYKNTISYISTINNSINIDNNMKINTNNLFENYTIFDTKNMSLYIHDRRGIYEYDTQNDKLVLILDFVNTGIDYSKIVTIKYINDDSFFFIEQVNSIRKLGLMKKSIVDITNKKIINVAFVNQNSLNIYEATVQFNKIYTDYQIILKDYSVYNNDDDREKGYKLLNLDIANNEIPDIIITDYGMPIDSYIKKGLFVDLYDYINNDSDISQDDFFECIFDQFEINGKLYELIPNISVATYVCRESFLNGESTWKLNDFYNKYDNLSENNVMIDTSNGFSVFDYLFRKNITKFINIENYTCDFINDDFYKMLRYSKKILNSKKANSDDVLLIQPVNVFSIDNYLEMKAIFNFDEILFIGYPSDNYNITNNENGQLYYTNSYTITTNSLNKEGAWEFIKHLMSDDVLTNQNFFGNISGFPSKLSAFDKMIEEVKLNDYYYINDVLIKINHDINEDSNMLEYSYEPINVTSDDIYQIKNILHNATNSNIYNKNIRSILNDEIMKYYNSDISEKEIANIIQSRINIYLNENYS